MQGSRNHEKTNIADETGNVDNDRSKQIEASSKKYEAMRQFLQDRLPPPWKIETLTFSVGVLGSADEQAWERALRALSIPDPHKQRKIVIAAINTALEGYSTFLAAC